MEPAGKIYFGAARIGHRRLRIQAGLQETTPMENDLFTRSATTTRRSAHSRSKPSSEFGQIRPCKSCATARFHIILFWLQVLFNLGGNEAWGHETIMPWTRSHCVSTSALFQTLVCVSRTILSEMRLGPVFQRTLEGAANATAFALAA